VLGEQLAAALVNIILAKGHNTFILGGQFIDYRGQATAGATPFGPTVDHHNAFGGKQRLHILVVQYFYHNCFNVLIVIK
jgi:hypothetical protein